MNKILLGADPELFVKNVLSNQYVSGHDLIPGTKREPYRVYLGAVQVDGMAVEFNINPVDSLSQWMNNISSVIRTLDRMITSKNVNYKLAYDPVATFDQKYFNSIPEYAKELGCDPDFSAYEMSENDRPETDEPFRTASGHVHIGWGEFDPFERSHFMNCCNVVKQLDAILYIPSLLWDGDRKRRTLYGKRGAFRPKPYGLEYRVLSNSWLRNPKLQAWVYSATRRAMKLLEERKFLSDMNFVIDTLDKETFSKEEVLDYYEKLLKDFGLLRLPEAATNV